ncbi:MAG TPA: glycosyltransferase family 9 protein [Solirubrobacteraceae bacterium]
MALRLVVLRALGLGDLLTAVPALRALARAHPQHERILLAPAALRPLVALLGGALHDVADTRGLRKPPRALPAVAVGADVAVNLHGRGPESTALLRAARPGRLVAFGAQARWREHEHEVARWCRLLRASGIAADPDDLDLAAPDLPAPHPGATVVHPGASAPARRWPAERWAAVARAAPGPVVVTAGPGEAALAEAVARRSGAAVFAGGLLELAALVAGAARVLSADTGIAHLATALGTPSVTLFGPTSPARWGPPAGRPQHRALWAGRHGDPHATTPDPGLLSLKPRDVLEAIA